MYFMRRRLDGWDYAFYFSLLIVVLWIILKSLGIIHTPFWLEYGVPLGGVALGVLTFYEKVFKNLFRLDSEVRVLKMEVVHINKDLEKVDSKVNHIDQELSLVKGELSIIKNDLSIVKTRVGI